MVGGEGRGLGVGRKSAGEVRREAPPQAWQRRREAVRQYRAVSGVIGRYMCISNICGCIRIYIYIYVGGSRYHFLPELR